MNGPIDEFMQFLRGAAALALWDFLTFLIAVAGAVAALIFVTRRRYGGFSLYPSYRIGTGHSLYPNVIYFAARNLGDAPLVICRPNFRPSKHLEMDDTAHGNLATGDYELKFRYLNNQNAVVEGHSFTTILLRHRESALAYVPVGRRYSEESFKALCQRRTLGVITFDIVTVGEDRPRVVRIRQKLRAIASERHDLSLGRDPAREDGHVTG
ncbi:MAG: hypothetical protein KJ041_06170 [Gammaproteobacteria bacterium]|nr:hypothetical protein [Gammaproteobacteria bacterium]